MVSETVVGVIVGGILGLISGLALTLFGKHLEEDSTRRYMLEALLSEIELNQRLLENDAKSGENLRKLVENPESFPEETVKIFQGITKDGYDIDIPKNKKFDRTFYSDASYKLGLLTPIIRKDIVKYYGKLKEIEYILIELKEIITTSEINPVMKHAVKITRTKDYFDKAEECFKEGDILIAKLKNR